MVLNGLRAPGGLAGGLANGDWYPHTWPVWVQVLPLLGVCPYLQNGDDSGGLCFKDG